MVTEQQQVVMQQPVYAQYPQQQVVMQQPQPMLIVKQQKPYPGFLENKALVAFIILGAIFLLLGALMVNIAPEVTNKDYSTISDATDRAKQMAEDVRTQKALGDYGTVFKSIGVFFIFPFLLMAAVMRTDLSDYTRFGMLLMVGLVFLAARFTIP